MGEKKTLLVTGASSEVGTALIKRIAGGYDRIWAHYCNSSDAIEDLKKTVGDVVVPIRADFGSVESTSGFIATIKDSGVLPDHIVHLSANKAGTLQFHKQTWDAFQSEIDTSFRSITMILKEFIPHMSKAGYGKVVMMLSSCVIGMPPRYQAPYVAVKYALLGLMKELATDYAAKGITVNAVSPDMMDTKFLSELPDLIKEKNASDSPLGRNIRTDEVIPAIEYLLSPGSDVVTGQNIAVTGGIK